MRKFNLLGRIARVFIATSFLLCSSPLYAQETQGLFYEWSFEKGLATRPSVIDLPTGYASVSENVRYNTEQGSTSKRGSLLEYGGGSDTSKVTGLFRLYLKDGTKKLIRTLGSTITAGNDTTGAFTTLLTVSSGDHRWDAVTWHDLLIMSDGFNQPVKTNGTDATYLGSCFAEDKGSGAGPNGEYNYKITFYTSSYEVLYNQVSNNVTVVDNDITLTMIPLAPDTYLGEAITGRKVYRSDAGGAGTYNLVPNTGTIADNTTVTIDDTEDDAAVNAEAAYPAGDATWRPPKGKYPLIHINRLFFANDPNTATDTGPSTIYHSKDGLHDVFENTDYFNIRRNDGDEITFIKNLLGKLTIGKKNTIQKLDTNGDIPSRDWEISDPFSHIGCQAPFSATNTPLGIFYIGWDGLYKFNGQNSILVSDLVTPTINDIKASNLPNVASILHENLLHTTYASTASGESSNNRDLIFDIVNETFTIDKVDVNTFCVLNAGTDTNVLFAGSSSSGAVFAYAISANQVIDARHSNFTGTFDDARFIPVGPPGGDVDSPVIELAWDLTLDNMVGTVNGATGDVNRPDTDGSYVSAVFNTQDAATYDKIYWNEILPIGNDATFQIRTDDNAAFSSPSGYSSAVSNLDGSDISGVSTESYTQYKVSLSTDDIDETPTLVRIGGYVVKIDYDTIGTSAEVSVPLNVVSGFTDLGYPGFDKSLRKLFVYHTGTTGTLTLTFTTLDGITDTFNINLATYPTEFAIQFTDGTLMDEYFKLALTEDSLSDVNIDKIFIYFDVEPLVY